MPKPARHKLEPNWRPWSRFTSAELPWDVRYWLLDDGSLTARLINQQRGQFAVQRLLQNWRAPLPSECRLLGLDPRSRTLVREVVLYQGELPVVFAHSVFPLASLEGPLRHLRRLQNKPLGAILFKHPGMHRSPFELAQLAGDSPALPATLRQGEPIWGRRSRFEVDNKPLLVSEFFLPDFRPWPKTLPVHRTQRGKVRVQPEWPEQ